MITDEMIEKAAQSDADFDGRTWMAMGRGERDRYRARAKASLGVVGPMLVAAEREACAQIADQSREQSRRWATDIRHADSARDANYKRAQAALEIASAIRSRTPASELEPETEDQTP